MTDQIAITLTLSVDEVNGILAALGELPTRSGAYPLSMKIKTLAEQQLPKQEEPKAE